MRIHHFATTMLIMLSACTNLNRMDDYQSATYTNLDTLSMYQFVWHKKGEAALVFGHFGLNLEICDQTSEFVCFKGEEESLAFAVPRGFSAGSSSWHFNGRDYALITPEKVENWMNDFPDDFYLIETKGSKPICAIRYGYRRKEGIIALWISARENDESACGKFQGFVLTSGQKGFLNSEF